MLTFSQRGELIQHKSTAAHAKSLQRINKNLERQMLLKDSVHKTSPFNFELCKAMVAANIPFAKLDNSIFKTFLEVNTKHNIPDRTTLTKFYLPKVFAAVSNKDFFEY